MKMSGSSRNNVRPSSSDRGIPHTRIEDESHIEQIYTIGKKLGEGTFGIVREVVHKATSEKWACKAVNKEKAGNPKIKLLEREVVILKRVHHQHIIKLKEIFETPKKMYFIMELCDRGELADVLKEKGTFSEAESLIIIKRLVDAIAYLHKNGMVHRDLKLENILLGTNPKDKMDKLFIKVTDFGLSVVKSGAGIDDLLEDFCGTPLYMSPEIIDNNPYTEKCDVWAMGIIAYLLLCGHPPFNATDEASLRDMIRTANVKDTMASDPSWENIGEEAKNCIQCMLTAETTHRKTSAEILEHPWLTGKPLESMRTENVLDLMKKWRMDLASDDGVDDDSVDDELNEMNSCSNVADSQSKNHISSAKKSSSTTSAIKSPPSQPKKTSPQAKSKSQPIPKSKSPKATSANALPTSFNTNTRGQSTMLVPPATKTTQNGLSKMPTENGVASRNKKKDQR